MTEVSNARKREISLEVQTILDRLGERVDTLETSLKLIDDIATNDPGDQRQQDFYAAVRELAAKVAAVKFPA